jgi:hypothetical protein
MLVFENESAGSWPMAACLMAVGPFRQSLQLESMWVEAGVAGDLC